MLRRPVPNQIGIPPRHFVISSFRHFVISSFRHFVISSYKLTSHLQTRHTIFQYSLFTIHYASWNRYFFCLYASPSAVVLKSQLKPLRRLTTKQIFLLVAVIMSGEWWKLHHSTMTTFSQSQVHRHRTSTRVVDKDCGILMVNLGARFQIHSCMESAQRQVAKCGALN